MKAIKYSVMHSEPVNDIYFKFSSNLKLNQKILQKYPLNDQQQRICKKLNVPFHIWSFFLFKESAIYNSLIYGSKGQFYNRNFMYSDYRYLIHDYSQFENINLTEIEMFFIFYNEFIYFYHQRCFCFCFNNTFPSLQNLCSHALFNSKALKKGFKKWIPFLHKHFINKRIRTRLKEWTPFLPKPLLSQLQDEMEVRHFCVSMPKYCPEETTFQMCIAYYSLNNLFSKIDPLPFSKEFVVWFQKEPNVYHQFQSNSPFKIVFFYFERFRPFRSITYKFCLRCMKQWQDKYRFTYGFRFGLKRCFYLYDVSYTDQMKKMKNPGNWCAKCKRIPLFQILSLEKYMIEYDKGPTLKVDIFL